MELTINIPNFSPLIFNTSNYAEELKKVDEKQYSRLRDSIKSDTKLDTFFRNVIDILSKMTIKQDSNSYFLSEKHKLEFCILKHEGHYLDDELGITRRHYVDKKIAKEWRNTMQKIFHDDKNFDSERYKRVSSKINKIYDRMVGKA